jgi:signal transduction histidine kinase/CheY-like chemotaxis protein/HAMP domain-containing protein
MKNLSISAQLIISFFVKILLIVGLGVLSYVQVNKIHEQTKTLYNYPLMVRAAIGRLQSDILEMRLETRNLMLAKTNDEKQDAVIRMKVAEVDAEKQFDVLDDRYLGDKMDVNNAYENFLSWKTAREENTKLAMTGEIEQVKENIKAKGKVGIYREKMLVYIGKMDDYAKKKAVTIYAESNKEKNTLNAEMIILFSIVVFISLVILINLLRNLRKPIKELTNVTTRFREGDMNVRSELMMTNEFGALASSFNLMVEQIKQNVDLSEKTEQLADAMLVEENSHRFFRELLPALAELTNSQMAAVYLLTDDNQNYVHYESVGMDEDAIDHVFPTTGFHGEFGGVLSSRKIQYVKNIPLDTRFVFHTVSGKLIPREIITIPILSGGRVIAIISLASIQNYSDEANQLIDKTFDILTARVEGVLAYRTMRRFAKQLEVQNDELEAQQRELERQASELNEQNRELEMQKVQLHEASRLKTNFLSNMSHELRTPLNSVIALSGVLHRRLANKIPEDEYSYLEVIERNGKHLLELINDILDISRIEAGREEVEITKFNLNNLISEVVGMLQPQSKQKGIDLIQQVPIGELYIESDYVKCRHILQNLVANAVKFTEKGKVEILAASIGSTLKITVTDTGIGISADHILHIFDEFRQADSSTSRRFGGTGLGLAIARKYATLLGGDVGVKSVPGEGSEFSIQLPMVYKAGNHMAEVVETGKSFNRANYNEPPKIIVGKTILLVEDSEPAIIQIHDMLTENNYKVLDARDGQQALSIIAQTVPDAMILDLMMPGVDGFEVLKSIREADETAQVPVLILTAKHITKEELKFLKRNNIHQLIQKGDVNRNELLNAVASMVSIRPEAKQEPKLQVIAGKPVVLVVEDNTDNMLTVKAILEGKFEVLEAVDGAEGIAAAEKYKPNLILMDISLPVMDGIEAFKQIRKNRELENIPVIALTASALLTDRETILAHGFDGFLPKPIQEKLFFETINKILYGK